MKMQLVSLVLENFKCFGHREFRFDGRDADIRGENGLGKSTVYDSFTWLLFGKDSLGRKNFGIKPTRDGQVKDHAAITSVEASLLVDGEARILKRTYYEVWSTKRGSPDASFDGHSSDFFVDGVPCKKSEFARRVGEIVDENLFQLLTDVHYFASGMPWQARRAALFDVASVAADAEILASSQQFAPLASAMKGLPLDDYRKKLAAQRKGLNNVRTDIPARMDECKKTVDDLSGIDFAALGRQKAEAQARWAEAQQSLDQLRHDGGRTALRNQLDGIRNELGQLENENAAYRLRQKAASGQDEAARLRKSLDSLRARESGRQRDLAYFRGLEKDLGKEISVCRTRWDAANQEQFEGGVCPSCGQALPPDKLKESAAAFEKEKKCRKDEAVCAANRAKAMLKGVQEDIARLGQEAAADLKEMEGLDSRLKSLEAAPKPEIQDIDGYAARKAGLEAQAEGLRKEIDGLDLQSAAGRKVLQDKLAGIDQELNRLSGELAKEALLKHANHRMEELRAQAAEASNELNKVDGMLSLCEEFVRYKVKFIEDSINSRFSLVRFRLFREQVNGGLEDCCEVTVNGIGCNDGLNDGARFNAGIDIINTFSRHYGVYVPLFVDNAESVTKLLPADTQVIRLVVDERYDELRCELK